MVDWIWPAATPKQQKENRRDEVIPRICEHLADGAKHFLLSRPHDAVVATEKTEGAFDPETFDAAMRSLYIGLT